MRGYFGIYWTFPVRWVGLTHFESVEQAARISRTIRYQREVIRREVTARKGALAAEAAFMEQAPDRGTLEVAEEIARAVRKHPELTPVLVDFAQVLGWRRHSDLKHRMEEVGALFLPPDPTMVDGHEFDPAQHFRDWAERWAAHANSKDDHRAAILACLHTAALGGTRQHAEHLNANGLQTHTGKPWTPDNLRKFLKG